MHIYSDQSASTTGTTGYLYLVYDGQ